MTPSFQTRLMPWKNDTRACEALVCSMITVLHWSEKLLTSDTDAIQLQFSLTVSEN